MDRRTLDWYRTRGTYVILFKTGLINFKMAAVYTWRAVTSSGNAVSCHRLEELVYEY